MGKARWIVLGFVFLLGVGGFFYQKGDAYEADNALSAERQVKADTIQAEKAAYEEEKEAVLREIVALVPAYRNGNTIVQALLENPTIKTYDEMLAYLHRKPIKLPKDEKMRAALREGVFPTRSQMEALMARNVRMYGEDADYRAFVDEYIADSGLDEDTYWNVVVQYSDFALLLEQNLSNYALEKAGKEPIYGFPETNPALQARAEGKGSDALSFADIEKSDGIAKKYLSELQ